MVSGFGLPLFLALVLALPLQAQDQDPERGWKLSGFGTLGLAWNSTRQAEFLRDLSQPGGASRTPATKVDSRLGLQWETRGTGPFQGTLQAISKYRYDGTCKPDLSWAFLGWTPQPEVQVRAGRLGVELFLNSDSRDVGYSYLWVRPPVACFGLVPVTRVDGLDATGLFPVGSQATLRLKAYYGATSERLPLAGSPPLDLAGDRIGGLISELQTGAWRGRLAYSRFQVYRDFPSLIGDLQAQLRMLSALPGGSLAVQTASAMGFAGSTIQWFSAGVSREEGPVQAQGMITHFRSNATVLPPSWAGLVSLGYRTGRVTPYGVWSRIASDRPKVPDLSGLVAIGGPQVAQLAGAAQGFLNANWNTQTTWSAGVRWDPWAKADLKLQVDRISSQLPDSFWDISDPAWNGRATVATVTLDFVF